MSVLLRALESVQPVPHGWEALFLTFLFLSVIAAVLTYVQWRASIKGRAVVLLIAAVLGATSLSVLNARYMHVFEPAADETAQTHPGPLWTCTALEEYRAALGSMEAISPDEWKDRVYSARCKASTLAAVVLVLMNFILETVAAIWLLLMALEHSKPLVKAATAARNLFSG